MAKITVEIDPETLNKAQHLAQSRHTSLSNLIAEVIKLLAASHVIDDPIIGMVADEPELADVILKDIEARRSKLNV